MTLGVIADDVTGATDIASVMLRTGASVVQTLGVPDSTPPAADAIVVSTKTRMAPVPEALATVTQAHAFLTQQGAESLFFKYCSTFDSTPQGNIGPIADHLLDATGAQIAIACPSYPTMRRTVYQGHLFVGGELISDSPMRDHPLTPMRDPDLVRVLAEQSRSQIGLVDLACVEAGPTAIAARLEELAGEGKRLAITDAIFDAHVAAIGKAVLSTPLVTGGAALGGAISALRPKSGGSGAPFGKPGGPVALLSGSCSAMTQRQVAYIADKLPSRTLDPLALAGHPAALQDAIDWACEQARSGNFLVSSTADPASTAKAQAALGREAAASALEDAFAQIASALADAGLRNFVVAGGETSGAVSSALGVSMMTFGAEIAPGVPLTYTLAPEGFLLALKSGNFGDEQFFARAMEAMTA